MPNSLCFFSMNPGLPPTYTHTHTQGPPNRDSPPLMTGDNLLSLPISPPPAPPLIDCREISPHVPLSQCVNTANTWRQNYTRSCINKYGKRALANMRNVTFMLRWRCPSLLCLIKKAQTSLYIHLKVLKFIVLLSSNSTKVQIASTSGL